MAMPKAKDSSAFWGYRVAPLVGGSFHDAVELYLVMLCMMIWPHYQRALAQEVSTSVFLIRSFIQIIGF